MSFSNPTLTNPAQHFFEWKGGDGKLQFYDKEKKENITVPLPFEFIPIDQLATITGYSKAAKNSYYSNEVRSTLKDEFTIKLKGQTVFTGLYKNDQGIAQVPKGAQFTTSIYIVHKNKAGKYIMGNLKANGSALGAWIEFNKSKIIGNGKVVMTRGAVQESPVGQFYPPEFKYESLTPEDFEAATELDKTLQIYLSQYLAAKPEEPSDSWPSDDHQAEDTAIHPERQRLADARQEPVENEEDVQSLYNSIASSDETEEEGFSVDDIPF